MENNSITTISSPKLDKPLFFKKGLTDRQIWQLLSYAQTDEGLNYTSDKTRFVDRPSYEEFSKHILAYYALTDEEDNLLGIIWFDDLDLYLNQENPSDYGVSFAIRLYGEARGKSLAVPFTDKSLEDFKKTAEYQNHKHPKIWLAVSPENAPAIAVYRKSGFKDLKIDEKYHKLLMILEYPRNP